MCSRPRYVHHGSDGASDSEDEADYGPLFRSPALGNVECLSLQGFRAEYLRPRVEDSMVPSRLHTWDPIPSVRHLELEECNVPFLRFARILPNLRTIVLDDVLDMWQDNGTLGETWPSLDRITVQSTCDSVTESEWWKVACPVHYVDLRCSESGGPIDEDDGGIEAVAEGIRDTKPVALAVQLKACVDRYFWEMLARPPFTLKCLEINLHMSGEQLMSWLATVVPILANLELMLLQVHIHSPLDGSATPSVDMHQLGGLPEPEVDFELFRAVCQLIPAVIAKSIPSLRYLSILTEEGSRVDGMHGWWRTTWEDGGRKIEVIPAVQGEAIIAHVRSTPGAEQIRVQLWFMRLFPNARRLVLDDTNIWNDNDGKCWLTLDYVSAQVADMKLALNNLTVHYVNAARALDMDLWEEMNVLLKAICNISPTVFTLKYNSLDSPHWQ
ncbi:predicted protein [Postia placenta Mad-698-R]|nr:predicted protein [Postia placenta Mad-698-R]